MNFLKPGLALFCLGAALASSHAQPDVPEKLPDLVVSSVKLSPQQPFAGDVARLSATVKNIGTAPTQDGVVLGGIFRLNGQVFGYTDTYKHTLAPGESVTLQANGGGGQGNGTWLAKAGTYTLGFLIDDVNRNRELNETNNDSNSTPILVRTFNGPDLIIKRVTWTPTTLKRRARVRFAAFIENAGNAGTPSRLPLQVSFTLDGKAFARGASATNLRAGERFAVESEVVKLPQGRHILRATVDPNKRVAERRADNNAMALTFWVDQNVSATPKSADAFADSIGVCTHIGYFDTSYGNYEIIKARLLEAKIRHIRDGINIQNIEEVRRFQDLGAHGVRFTMLTDPRQPIERAQEIARRFGPFLDAIEGPNEPNLFYADLFPNGVRDYQNRLYAAFKADPQTKSLPILAPALAFPNEIAARMGAVAADYGALHPYPGGQLPDTGLDETIKAARITAPGKPQIITETGYNTAINVTSGQPAVSERTSAKYISRLLLEAFNRDIRRTFLYEFSDDKLEPEMRDAEQHFGMIRFDGSPKPSFVAVKNLIALLSDRASNAATPPLSLPPLTYKLSGDVTNLHSTLLQKRDGRRYLLLWVNGRSYDQDTRSDALVPPQSLTLRFDTTPSRATIYRPATTATAERSYTNTKTLTLNVPDEPLVIELAPERKR